MRDRKILAEIRIKFSILILMLFLANATNATKISASTFGYNATNSTAAFQEAIQSNYDTVVVDLQANNWNIEPSTFFSLTNKVIIFERGVVLNAIAGVYGQDDCLFKMVQCSNINLVGYRATFKMNKPEYVLLDDSEYRHCLALVNCINIKVLGLTFRDSGGDGIYISGENNYGDGISYCENITIKDVKCINNYRQGLSICSVQNMLVSNSLFTLTKGTLPEAGVDVEPYETYQRIVNLKFKKCSFTKNGWAGISVALTYMDSTSLPVSIKFIDCNLKNNRLPSNEYAACEIFVGDNTFSPVQGSVLFERCTVQDSQWTALYSRKTSDAFHTTFKDCVFSNVSQQQVLYNNPIFFEVPDYFNPCPALGGFTFDHVLVKYNTNFDFLRVYGWETLEGLADIDGNFTVIEPFGNGVSYELVQDTTNVTFTYTTQTELTASTVNLTLGNPHAVECDGQYATFTASRISDNVGYPLSVFYDTVGSAYFSDDVELMPTSLVIPANYFEYTDSISAQNDLIEESTENFSIYLKSSILYNGDTLQYLNFDVEDCNLISGIEENKNENKFELFPNPSQGNVVIASNKFFEKVELILYNNMGQEVTRKFCAKSNQFELDMVHLADGIYFVEIKTEDISNKMKLVKN